MKKARRILEAMEQAAKEGRGAVSLDGRLIDIASIRMAAGADRQGGPDRRRVSMTQIVGRASFSHSWEKVARRSRVG